AAVGTAARQGHEQLTGPDLARVDLDPGDHGVGVGRHQPAPGRLGDLLEGERDHAEAPSSTRSSSAATSGSSKGTLRPPANSWPCSWPLPATRTASPGPAMARAARMAARRSTSTRNPSGPVARATPPATWATIAPGASERGLAEGTTAPSA